MANSRILSIVTADLSNDYAKKEAELEEVINNMSMKMDDRVLNIKRILGDLSEISRSMEIWSGMMKEASSDNEKDKVEEK